MRRLYTAVVLAAALIVALAFVACDDDNGGSKAETTATEEDPGTTAPGSSPGSTTPTVAAGTTPGEGAAPSEGGEAPIFWRTEDNFQSVVAGQEYLVNFRITNGYDEPVLYVFATCPTCSGADDRGELVFEGQNSPPFPAGSDLPGSYYPMNMLFPVAGPWELQVVAGDDEVTISIAVSDD